MWVKSLSITTSLLLMLLMDVNSNTLVSESNAKLEIRSNSSLPYVIIRSSITLDCVLLQNNRRADGVEVRWILPGGYTIRQSGRFFGYNGVFKQSSLLIFNNVQINDGGTYTCETEEQNGRRLSAKAEIRLISGLLFSKDCETDQIVVADHGEGTIKCNTSLEFSNPHGVAASSSAGASNVFDVHTQWFKNGVPYVPSAGRCHVSDFIGIVCDEFVEADAGNYTIVAQLTSPVMQTDTRTIVVKVHTFPHIQNFLTEVVAVENSTVKLTCTATGNPHATYSWRNDRSNNIDNSLRRFIHDAEKGTLIIRDVSRHDAGFFSCTAQNSVGGDLSKMKLVVTTTEGVPFEKDQEVSISLHKD